MHPERFLQKVRDAWIFWRYRPPESAGFQPQPTITGEVPTSGMLAVLSVTLLHRRLTGRSDRLRQTATSCARPIDDPQPSSVHFTLNPPRGCTAARPSADSTSAALPEPGVPGDSLMRWPASLAHSRRLTLLGIIALHTACEPDKDAAGDTATPCDAPVARAPPMAHTDYWAERIGADACFFHNCILPSKRRRLGNIL